MLKLIIFLFCIFFFIYALRMFSKLNMIAFKFYTGAIGLFLICIIFFKDYLENILDKFLFILLDLISVIFPIFESFSNVSTLLIHSTNGIISMNLTFECSGLIEILVFFCLSIFFPFRNKKRKIFLILFGFFALVLSNIIRIIFIAYISATFGLSVYSITHMILARILFFVLTMSIYYFVFTKVHVKEYEFGGVNAEYSN